MTRQAACLLATLACLVAAPSRAYSDEMRGLVLESYVGSRPRDADYLLAPLVDSLRDAGFAGSSVAATRIQSMHSLPSISLETNKLEEARRLIKEGYAAYINLRFEGAIESSLRGIELLKSRPRTMVRDANNKALMRDALITMAMAYQRLGNEEAIDEILMEYARSFPDKEIEQSKYGRDGLRLYQRLNRMLAHLEKGTLRIAAAEGTLVYVNERHQGIGSLSVELYPGPYRIYTQTGANAGRVHVTEIEAGRDHTVVVDPVLDASLKTGNMVGFVFHSEQERLQHQLRLCTDLGRALGVETVVLVGFQEHEGHDNIFAASIQIEDGQLGPSARIPIPERGAPSVRQLRSLAAFVTGSGPPASGIEVMGPQEVSVLPPGHPHQTHPALTANRVVSESRAGMSPAWRYAAWGLGLASVASGAYLISLDGEGACDLQPGQIACPDTYDTFGPGIGLVAGGAVLGIVGFTLWPFESASGGTSLAVAPRLGQDRAGFMVSGEF